MTNQTYTEKIQSKIKVHLKSYARVLKVYIEDWILWGKIEIPSPRKPLSCGFHEQTWIQTIVHEIKYAKYKI